MINFPNAKINIGLRVLRRRSDGFHDLESIFYPVGIKDALEVVESDELKFSVSGVPIPGASVENLCMKAYKLVRRDFDLPPVHIHLHKRIPVGAGLGGGSADASFLIRLLNEKFKLEMDAVRMQNYASLLGSDCAFFINNQVSYATSRGEVLKPIELNLARYHLILIMPPVHVPTSEAFRGINLSDPAETLSDLIRSPVERWKHSIFNDFEHSVFKKYPQIATIKQGLYKAGAVYASMSGSGAAVYGLFTEPVRIPEFELYNQVFYGVQNI